MNKKQKLDVIASALVIIAMFMAITDESKMDEVFKNEVRVTMSGLSKML